MKAGQIDGSVPLHHSTLSNPADRQVIYTLGVSGRAFGVASDHQRPLRFGIHLAIRRSESCQKQHSALHALGVAHGRNCDIDLHSRARERRQRRCDKYRGDVLHHHHAGRDLHPHPKQCIGQRLHRKEGLLGVARARQSNHQAIADQLIVANALNLGDVAYQHLAVGFGPEQSQGRKRAQSSQQGEPSPPNRQIRTPRHSTDGAQKFNSHRTALVMKFGGRTPSEMMPLPFISISRLLRAVDGTVLLGPMSPGRTIPRTITFSC